MVILGGVDASYERGAPVRADTVGGSWSVDLQARSGHRGTSLIRTPLPRRTLQKPCAYGDPRELGVSYER